MTSEPDHPTNPTITAYITENALTKGIEKVQAVHLLHLKQEYGSDQER